MYSNLLCWNIKTFYSFRYLSIFKRFIVILTVQTKLFSDLYPAKFLDTAKLFFPCTYNDIYV